MDPAISTNSYHAVLPFHFFGQFDLKLLFQT